MLYITLIGVIRHQSHHLNGMLIRKRFSTTVSSHTSDGMRHVWVLFMLYITLSGVIRHQSDHLSDVLIDN